MLRIERPIEPLSKITRGVVIRHLAADDTSSLVEPQHRKKHARIHARAMCKPTEARDQLSKPLLRYRCIAKKSATLRAGRELSSAKRELEILHGWTVDVADVADDRFRLAPAGAARRARANAAIEAGTDDSTTQRRARGGGGDAREGLSLIHI